MLSERRRKLNNVFFFFISMMAATGGVPRRNVDRFQVLYESIQQHLKCNLVQMTPDHKFSFQLQSKCKFCKKVSYGVGF